MCAAPRGGTASMQMLHERAAGEQHVGGLFYRLRQARMLRRPLVAEFQHVAQHSDAAPAGCSRSTSSAARIEAPLPL